MRPPDEQKVLGSEVTHVLRLVLSMQSEISTPIRSTILRGRRLAVGNPYWCATKSGDYWKEIGNIVVIVF